MYHAEPPQTECHGQDVNDDFAVFQGPPMLACIYETAYTSQKSFLGNIDRSGGYWGNGIRRGFSMVDTVEVDEPLDRFPPIAEVIIKLTK